MATGTFRRGHALAVVAAAALLAGGALAAQDAQDEDDGFGSFGEPESGEISTSLGWSGEVRFGAQNFFDESAIQDQNRVLKGMGRLNLDGSVGPVDAALKLRVDQATGDEDWLRLVDEAWVRVNLGSPYLEAGLMKQTWGKADSLKAIDVVNPGDLSDLSSRSLADNKIAMPMVHGVLPLGDSATLEAVWLPVFDDMNIPFDGPWAPKQLVEMREVLTNAIVVSGTTVHTTAGLSAAKATQLAEAEAEAKIASILDYPDTWTLDYQQAGARLTGTVNSVDLGIQYFWGYLQTPVMEAGDNSALLANLALAAAHPTIYTTLMATSIPVKYNRYHHIGVDFAAVLFDFNSRAEFGANLTDDWSGDKTDVYNPSLVWAAGFDRELFEGITLMVEAKGSVTLFHDGITASTDIQNGTDMSSTMVMGRLNQKFLKDKAEWELACIWGIEDQDFAVAPAVTFDLADASLRVGGRWFGGKEDGNMGQYAKSSYAEVSVGYKF